MRRRPTELDAAALSRLEAQGDDSESLRALPRIRDNLRIIGRK
jgi:hypothetical protein